MQASHHSEYANDCQCLVNQRAIAENGLCQVLPYLLGSVVIILAVWACLGQLLVGYARVLTIGLVGADVGFP